MLKVIKTEQSIYECLLGFCFNNIFCAATNFGCIDSLPNSRNEEMTGDGFLGAIIAGLFEQQTSVEHIRGYRASAVASSIFFMVLFWMLFEVRSNRMCRKLNKP